MYMYAALVETLMLAGLQCIVNNCDVHVHIHVRTWEKSTCTCARYMYMYMQGDHAFVKTLYM